MKKVFSLVNPFVAYGGAIALHAGVIALAIPSAQNVEMPPQQMIEVTIMPMAAPQEVQKKPVEKVVKKPIEKIIPVAKKAIEPAKEISKVETRQIASLSPAAGITETKIVQEVTTEPVFNAAYLNNPPPEYPSQARRRNIEGKVVLNVKVSEEGRAENVKIINTSGSHVLDEAALDAVWKWKFIPARKAGEVTSAWVNVPVIFKLN